MDNFYLQVLLILALIGLNAFFAASEIAVISLNERMLRKKAEKGDKKAILLQNLISEPSRFLATIQVGVTLASLMAGAVASQSFALSMASFLTKIGLPFGEAFIEIFSVALITLIISYFSLVLGELVPKRFALQSPDNISRATVKPLLVLSRLAAPFIRFLSFSTNTVIKLLGGDPGANEEQITEEEIRLMVDVGQEKGVIRRAEKEMINNIFEFDNTPVSQVMTHRTDITGIPVSLTLEEIAATLVDQQYSRIPVYKESIDCIVGILHVKDLIPYLYEKTSRLFDLKTMMRRPLFVPESKKTDELLKEMQKSQTHMAVVIDEFGGTAGIVTIEDLLEEIVGNIFDEYDTEEREIEEIDEKTFVIDGTISLEEIADLFNARLPVKDYDTLGGFVMGLLGRIPANNEHPTAEHGALVFQVESMDEKRIQKVRITCK